MIPDRKDFILKYIELPKVFYHKANGLNLSCKQSQRVCEKMVSHLSKQKPKSGIEFERHEFMKEFVLKTAKANEETIELLAYIQQTIQDISIDAAILMHGTEMRNQIREQSDKVEALISQRETTIKQIYNEVKQRIKGAA